MMVNFFMKLKKRKILHGHHHFVDDGQFCYGTEEAQNSTLPFSTDEVKKRLNKMFYTILIKLIYVTSA